MTSFMEFMLEANKNQLRVCTIITQGIRRNQFLPVHCTSVKLSQYKSSFDLLQVFNNKKCIYLSFINMIYKNYIQNQRDKNL